MKSFLDIAKFSCCPLKSLNWQEWEKVAKLLPKLIKNGTIRKIVDDLPEVDLKGFNENEMKRAYTIVTFIAHSYIRGDVKDEVVNVKAAYHKLIINNIL